MGSEFSQEYYEGIAREAYEDSLQYTCLTPDIGIDEALLKYSGMNSNSVLQTYSNNAATTVPGYVDKLGSRLAPLTSVPNAVGLGALVISLIIEIIIKSTTQTNDNTYSILRRVFAEEKASAVRDTMTEYLMRHVMFVNNEQRLREELQRVEQQLSNDLTVLRNSLLLDGQMSTRGLKIWVNGAFFHLQMLIHEARLNTRTRSPASHTVHSINAAIDNRLQDLDKLLEKYKTYKIGTTSYFYWVICMYTACTTPACIVKNSELKCQEHLPKTQFCVYDERKAFMINTYVTYFFTNYEPIYSLKSQFSNIKNNLNTLINQHDTFFLPPRA